MGRESEKEFDQQTEEIALPIRYRCICGAEFGVDPNTCSPCPQCNRMFTPEQLEHGQATVSFARLPVGNSNHPSNSSGNATQPASRLLQNITVSAEPVISIDDDEDDPIGENFGHFQILEKLGKGGMGRVYRALDQSLQRYVAVKVVAGRSGREVNQEVLDLLLQEAIAQARLNHQNVVAIYYVGQRNQQPFLAMELVNGFTLSEIKKAHDFSYQELVDLGIQICDALEHASKFGIVHGDIKPSNILVTEERVIKLADFGLARQANQDTGGQISGTPNYLAPELCRGEPHTIQTDMYALGVTLFELAFSKLPFGERKTSISKMLKLHQEAPVSYPEPFPDYYPPEFKELLDVLLAKNPQDRFPNYSVVREKLVEIRPDVVTPAKRAPRFLALMIDFVLLGFISIPILVPTGFVVGNEFADGIQVPPAFRAILALALLALPFIYASFVSNREQSLGQKLLQIKAVNKYGLIPSRKTRMLRSLLRTLWFSQGLFDVAILVLTGSESVASALTLGLSLFVFVDCGIALFGKTGSSLHDIVCKTKMVLDVKPDSRS